MHSLPLYAWLPNGIAKEDARNGLSLLQSCNLSIGKAGVLSAKWHLKFKSRLRIQQLILLSEKIDAMVADSGVSFTTKDCAL